MKKTVSLGCLSVFLPALLIQNLTLAQIVPDATLPVNSRVTLQDATNLIEDGTTSGTHLFHSFSEFSVPTGRSAHFNNATNIETIFTRITGNSVSEIDGLIRANGTANLFLLNPNGIIFGPNAALDIGGSFLGTTADSIKFADGFEFSVTNPQETPLLTVSAPVGLQMGVSPGKINVEGFGNNVIIDLSQSSFEEVFNRNSRPDGIAVKPGQSLALLGGEIVLNGGNLTAEAGRIDIGSVESESFVSLNPIINSSDTIEVGGWRLGYENALGFQNIKFTEASSLDVSGIGNGDVQLQGRQVEMLNGSIMLAFTEGNQSGRDLVINATESVEIMGQSSTGQLGSGLVVISTPETSGISGGNITINTGGLLINNGAIGIIAINDLGGVGDAGDVTINALESIVISGIFQENISSGISSRSVLESTGNSGNITINTSRLLIKDGGGIEANTAGTGTGGSITINATDSVEIMGNSSGLFSGSGVFIENTEVKDFGFAGNININTSNLIIEEGQIGTDSFGTATGGNININASRLSIINQGQITSGTLGDGDGGNITLNISEFLQIIGKQDGFFATGLFSSAREESRGRAGNININTPRLEIQNKGEIRVSSRGQGNAGNLNINADLILLSNAAQLDADTSSITLDPNQQQATITLNSQNLILRQNSNITANARGENVIGGNIKIDTQVLTALENSDISANSEDFRGGQVNISAQGIFGTEFRLFPSDQTSDITATSERGAEFTGIVTVNTPELDPTAALVPLETNFLDPSDQIATGCQGDENSFTVVGRGGIPSTPTDPLSEPRILTDLGSSQHERITPNQSRTPAPAQEYVEATQWQLNEQGQVVLVATSPNRPELNASCSELSGSTSSAEFR